MKIKNLFIVAVAVVTTASCSKKPEACADISKTTVDIGENVTFTNCSTNGKKYEWDFGDGTKSTEQNATHAYSNGGTYTVKLKASSKNGKKNDEVSKTVTVRYPSQRFEGYWNVTENCTATGADAYVIEIISTGTTTVTINNFLNLFDGVTATISSDNITINPYAYFLDYLGNAWTINSGSGVLSGNTISFNYYVDDVDYAFVYGDVICTATATQ